MEMNESEFEVLIQGDFTEAECLAATRDDEAQHLELPDRAFALPDLWKP